MMSTRFMQKLTQLVRINYSTTFIVSISMAKFMSSEKLFLAINTLKNETGLCILT